MAKQTKTSGGRLYRKTTCRSCGRGVVAERGGSYFITKTGGAFCSDCEGNNDPQPVRDAVYPKDAVPVLNAAYFRRVYKKLESLEKVLRARALRRLPIASKGRYGPN